MKPNIYIVYVGKPEFGKSLMMKVVKKFLKQKKQSKTSPDSPSSAEGSSSTSH